MNVKLGRETMEETGYLDVVIIMIMTEEGNHPQPGTASALYMLSLALVVTS